MRHSYYFHLVKQMNHQFRTGISIRGSLVDFAGGALELLVRLFCILSLPLAPLFALLEMRAERNQIMKNEKEKQRMRDGIHKNGPG